ncbi:MAG: hypothetical protein KBT39_05390, partial [Bacteroidales bacterium]|nr:hypothetical protein [Bacteroidales bacterium]
ELQRFLVHAYNRIAFVIRAAVHFEHILHTGGKVCALLLGDAPFLDKMRLQAIKDIRAYVDVQSYAHSVSL